MFEMMSAEKMKSQLKKFGDESDLERLSLKPVQFKPSIIDRALISLGQILITTGLKLKYRQQVGLSREEAQTPNFLIML